MNAKGLFEQNSTYPVVVGSPGHELSAKAWLCECGQLFRDQVDAERCCRCFVCDQKVEKGLGSYHHKCWADEQAKELSEKLNKAEKLEKWSGFVYWEGHGRDGYFQNMNELKEYLQDNFEDEELTSKSPAIPEFVFVCDPVSFPGLDSESIIDDLTSNMFEDAYDHLNGIVPLRKAIAAFNKKNVKVISYEVNYTKAVRVPKIGPRKDGDFGGS